MPRSLLETSPRPLAGDSKHTASFRRWNTCRGRADPTALRVQPVPETGGRADPTALRVQPVPETGGRADPTALRVQPVPETGGRADPTALRVQPVPETGGRADPTALRVQPVPETGGRADPTALRVQPVPETGGRADPTALRVQPVPETGDANVSGTRPEADILDTELDLVDYGTDLTLACKVTGHPKPNIRWEDEDGSVFPSEEVLLEIPSVYLSYVTVPNVSENFTIYCKCENVNGGASKSIDIYVNRTFSFEVTETPQDTTVEYGDDLTLPCQVVAYPEATVEWYFNSTKIDPHSNPNIYIEGNRLTVRNVSVDDGGLYDCTASNEVERKTYSAIVRISGIVAPEVEVNETEIGVKSGDWVEIECRVTKGNPAPVVSWQFKSARDYDYDDLPIGAAVVDGKVKISSAEKHHGGEYRCTASNVFGKDSKDVTVNMQYAPQIMDNEMESVTVREGDTVQLTCEVEAVPKATVRWEMSQDDVLVTLDERHTTDSRHTLHFTAFWNDSGNYHCIAQNEVGRAVKTIKVNVLELKETKHCTRRPIEPILTITVPPYIEPPTCKTLHAKVGGQVDLACVVLYGSPAPTIKWEFIAIDSTSKIINRGNSTLHLSHVSQSDEGTYMCIAENNINVDRIIYSLKIFECHLVVFIPVVKLNNTICFVVKEDSDRGSLEGGGSTLEK
ncbi:putative hemicentin 1, partial [Operophtera brumata]